MYIKNRARGFSLIELLIVVVIIATLAGIAVPSYKKYIIKAKVIELINFGESFKPRIMESLSLGQGFRNDTFDDPTQFISKLELKSIGSKYVIEVTGNMNNLNIAKIHDSDLIIQLIGEEVEPIVKWTCVVDQSYAQYVPTNCHGAIEGVRRG
jgi:prepilin-type N-terminal cleavage/methylation domain-containing protein